MDNNDEPFLWNFSSEENRIKLSGNLPVARRVDVCCRQKQSMGWETTIHLCSDTFKLMSPGQWIDMWMTLRQLFSEQRYENI